MLVLRMNTTFAHEQCQKFKLDKIESLMCGLCLLLLHNTVGPLLEAGTEGVVHN